MPIDMTELERRVAHKIEYREEGKGGGAITGYAALFDVATVIGEGASWSYSEIIRRGAFAKTLKEADVRALFNHDPNYVLGRTTAGTLLLEEDELGLRYEITPPDTEFARGLVESIRRGDINGSSFAFFPVKQRWSESNDGVRVIEQRELLEVKLVDVSPVTFPAYADTVVSARCKDRTHNGDKPLNDSAAEPPQAGHSDDLVILRMRHEHRRRTLITQN